MARLVSFTEACPADTRRSLDEIFANPLTTERAPAAYDPRKVDLERYQDLVLPCGEFACGLARGLCPILKRNYDGQSPITSSLINTCAEACESALEAKVQQRHAEIDELTGLPNERKLMERLRTKLLLCPDDSDIGILFADMDDFGIFNKEYGTKVGDYVISFFAERIIRNTREEDEKHRIHGDEFAMIITLEGNDDLEDRTEELEKDLAFQFRLDGKAIRRITASIGYYQVTRSEIEDFRQALRSGDSGEGIITDILKKADASMRERKNAKKGISTEPETIKRISSRLIAIELDGALSLTNHN